MFGLITRKQHEAALALMAKANVDLEQERDELRASNGRLNDLLDDAKRGLDTERETIGRLIRDKGKLRQRLLKIANQETPGANATVKRMAAIARGEDPLNLKQFRDKGVA